MMVSPAFAGKKFAILGLARSGMAALEALLASGAELMVWDNREEIRAQVAERVMVADPMHADIADCDAIIVSPGIPLNTHPITARAAEKSVPIIGDIEIFERARADLPAHKLVGITGTNGKSTTTALIHHICETAGIPALMGGNIGLPILSQDPLPQGGVYILELSSYQIDLTRSLDCDISVLLNISPDHLDRYDGFDAYAASKARLFDMMAADKVAILGSDDEKTALIEQEMRDEGRIGHILNSAEMPLSGQADWPSLQGPHNMQNARAAVAAAQALGITEDIWRSALESFTGLPHRMERVAEHDGILFVNDSKATNAASAGPALAAYDYIHWILGGVAKSDHLDECAPYFPHVVTAYTIGESAALFQETLEPHMPVVACEMMVTAVEQAIANAKAGEVVLLSPACASFDQFSDFEARGNCFKQTVAAIIDGQQRSRDASAAAGVNSDCTGNRNRIEGGGQ